MPSTRKSGLITTVAGIGSKGFAGDGGPATQATTGGIYCLAFDAQGKRLYFADLDNRRIRVVDVASGVVSTVAGNGEKGIPTDGADACSAPLVDPRAVTVDGARQRLHRRAVRARFARGRSEREDPDRRRHRASRATPVTAAPGCRRRWRAPNTWPSIATTAC